MTKEIANYFSKWLLDNEIPEIAPQEIEKYFNEISEKHKASTVKRKFISLKLLFNEIHKNYKDDNPFKDISIHLPNKKVLPKTLTVNEVTLLLEVIIKEKKKLPLHSHIISQPEILQLYVY